MFEGKNGDVQKALEVIMDLLDYACWRNNLDVWRILKAIIENLRKEYVYNIFIFMNL